MKKMHISMLFLTAVCYVSFFLHAAEQLSKDTKRSINPMDGMKDMLDEMREMSRKMDKRFEDFFEANKSQVVPTHGQQSNQEVFLEISQDSQFVTIILNIKPPENLELTKDISIDVEDNLLTLQVPLKNGKVSLDIYENRITIFESHETKKETKEQDMHVFATSSQAATQTQLLPARVDVSSSASISAEYKEKDHKLILKLPKKVAKKIIVKSHENTEK